MRFLTYPTAELPPLTNYVALSLDAPELTLNDAHLGLFLLDATWRYASTMSKILPHDLPRRSLPKQIRTAYPRKQTQCPDPERGLASIEALYSAYKILGRDLTGLLDHYHWRIEFLEFTS